MIGPIEKEIDARLALIRFARDCALFAIGAYAAVGIVCHYFVGW